MDSGLLEKLALINKALEDTEPGDTDRVFDTLNEIVDPQDALNCEGCQ